MCKGELEFTEAELIWIARAAGLRTGTSNIRQKGHKGLTASGMLAMHNKLRELLPELNEKDCE